VNWKSLIFVSISTVAFIASCVWGYQLAAPYLEGVAVQGQVVENLKFRSRDGDYCRPLVEFLVAGEAKHRLIGKSGLQCEIGLTVKVLYVPKDPENAVIEDFRQLYTELFIAGFFWFLFIASSIGVFFLSRSSDKTYKTVYPKLDQKITKAAREQDRFALSEGKERILLKGVVDSVRKQHGASREEYVVICRATLPGAIRPEHFEAAPISVHPGRRILGKSVEIYVDPGDKTRYVVMLEPVLAEHRSAKP